MIQLRFTGWKSYGDHDEQICHVTLDKKSRVPAVHFDHVGRPDAVRDWYRIGEIEFYNHGTGTVETAFVSLVINGQEYSGKYIESHMAEVQMLLDQIYTEEMLQEATDE